MMDIYGDITTAIRQFFEDFAATMQGFGLPFEWTAWLIIFYSIPVWLIIIGLVLKVRRGGGGSVPDGVKAIIASTGDVSAGMSGTKKVPFLRDPSDALVFLKVEENAVEQAIAAIDFYANKGEMDESLKDQMTSLYQERLGGVRAAIMADEKFKELVDTSQEVDRARSDYLRKMEAMSGTQVETEADTGPPSVGMPGKVSEGAPAVSTPATEPPGGGAPGGGPPGGGVPGGAPPGGGVPGGAPPGGGAPSGGPPGGGAPGGGPPGGGAPGGAPPDGTPGGTAPDSGVPSGPPGGGAPDGAPSGGPKSSLQSEMLAEMERLKSLMSGD
ncbi:MAG: hypothetical protein RTU92_12245 [Candidatus Thorarchaeota archaeon]